MICRRRRPCELNGEEGSLLLSVGLVAVVLVLASGVAAVGSAVAALGQAESAADAAALAAAPVTFSPFGAKGSPTQEAARFASLNGAKLERCRCAVDRSFASRTVSVRVSRALSLPGLGWVRLQAESRATFEPAALIPRG